MAEQTFKVNEAIELVYQAPNKQSSLTIIAEIFLPNGAKDSNFPDIILTEMGGAGVYKDIFTPDVQGEWKAVIHIDDGDGQVVKRYSVGAHNVHSVGEGISAVDGKVDVVDGKTDSIVSKADSIETKVDSIVSSVGALDTPPMVS